MFIYLIHIWVILKSLSMLALMNSAFFCIWAKIVSEKSLVISSAYLRSIINACHQETNHLSSSVQHIQTTEWQPLRRLQAERGAGLINQRPEGSIARIFGTSAGCWAEDEEMKNVCTDFTNEKRHHVTEYQMWFRHVGWFIVFTRRTGGVVSVTEAITEEKNS